MLTHWIQRHVKNNKKEYADVLVPNFVTYLSNDNSPNAIIYKIIIRIREIFNIRQRLELSEEKLRINFYYWLDLASRKMKNLKYFDGDLVIIIEGVNCITDQDKHTESSLKFWLPRVLPDRVKLILSISDESHNLEYLRKIGCRFLDLKINREIQREIMDLYATKENSNSNTLTQEINACIREKMESLKNEFVNLILPKTLFSCFLPLRLKEEPFNFEAGMRVVEKVLGNRPNVDSIKQGIAKSQKIEDLLEFALEFFKDKFMKEGQFFAMISALCLNYKGLTKNEMMEIGKVNIVALESVLIVFGGFIIIFKNYLKITNPIFLQFYIKKYIASPESKVAVHKQIALVLTNSPICLRQLKELNNNLYLAADFFQLKQKISSIENFLLLFNEITKYDLFKFWKKLEEKGYDPIHEYNKSLELFDMHFNPKDDEIFMINVQIARFFKELSEFESPITPEFRHPLIKGKVVQTLDSIDYKYKKQVSVVEKSARAKTFYELDPCFKSLKISKGQVFENYRLYSSVFDVKNEEINTNAVSTEMGGESQNGKLKNYLEEIGILQELKAINILDSANNKILKQHESLNVEIPLNKQKFIEYFNGILNEKFAFKKKQSTKSESNFAFKVENENEEKKNPDDLMLINDQKEVVDNYTKVIMEIDLSIEKSHPKMFYYYKRWIWMNYPWICLSNERVDFSYLISFCYSDDKSYLNNEQEAALYFRCLQIIYNCKEKKNLVMRVLPNEPEKPDWQDKAQTGEEVGERGTPVGKLPIIRKNYSQKVVSSLQISRLDRQSNVNLLGSGLVETMSKEQQSKIVSIISTNNHTVSISKLTSVLQRSKFLEDSIMKNNMLDMQKLVFNNENYNIVEIYKSKIDNLNLVLDKWSHKEIMLLRRKNEQIVAELNAVVFRKNALMQQIAKLEEQKSFKQMHEKSALKVKQEETVSSNLICEKKLKEIHQKLETVMEQKKRYQEIIDICLINQISNEEWIRSLNFYLNNLKKVRVDQEKQLQVKTGMLDLNKAESKRIYENYLKNKEKRETFLHNFKKYVKQKEEIDRAIVMSDEKIVKEVKNRLLQETGQFRLESLKLNESTIKASKLHHDQELEQRLEKCMEVYKQIRPLVSKNYEEEDEDMVIDVLEDYDEEWYKNERFQKFMSNLQINKKLEVSSTEC